MMGCFLRGYDLVLADLKFGLTRRQRRALDPRTPHATAACGAPTTLRELGLGRCPYQNPGAQAGVGAPR
jgi:hypothetical protein